MPTILLIAGWRIYFWANENTEPIDVHAEKWIKYTTSQTFNLIMTI